MLASFLWIAIPRTSYNPLLKNITDLRFYFQGPFLEMPSIWLHSVHELWPVDPSGHSVIIVTPNWCYNLLLFWSSKLSTFKANFLPLVFYLCSLFYYWYLNILLFYIFKYFLFHIAPTTLLFMVVPLFLKPDSCLGCLVFH